MEIKGIMKDFALNNFTNEELENVIRKLLDRNGFASQKVDAPMPKQQPEAFRIRVMQPLKFGVEIIKPNPLKDFIIIGGRLNVSPPHQEAIEKMDASVRDKMFEDLRVSLAMQKPNYKMNIIGHKFTAIEMMLPIFVVPQTFGRDLFDGMDIINKMFFYAIFVMQKYFRESGVSVPTSQGQSSSQFYL
ncbi:hypothetical protein LCGC14_3150950 [marine sediment metagenome]|uniref:DUF2299 domain-containing protein n=1 Tax=marine sediment metagenome TaxID=412755 RepID=A0A0F8VU41_9ZZZZ|nr:MAG: hypothetical protein HeimC3_28070 [Candidatus Heimdallarchaeota archaeon LC_3]